MSTRQKALYTSFILCFGFAAALAYHLYVARIRGLDYYPYNTFLFRPSDQFGDFLDAFNAGQLPYMEAKTSRAIFPFFMLLCRVLFLIDHRSLLLVLYLGLFLLLLGIGIERYLGAGAGKARHVLVLAVIACSYPVLISLDRANFENMAFLLILGGTHWIRRRSYLVAAGLFGIAIALKPYSAFFLPLLLAEGQFLPAMGSVAVAGGLSLASLLILVPSPLSALSTLRLNLDLYNATYVIGNEGLYFGDSLFGMIKTLIFLVGDHYSLFASKTEIPTLIQALMGPYFWISSVAFLVIAAVLCMYRSDLWVKAAVLAACLNLLPYVGSSYRELYFIIPLLLLISSNSDDPLAVRSLTLLALIMVPQGYLHFSFSGKYRVNPGELDASVLVTPILAGLLLSSLLLEMVRRGEHTEAYQSLRSRLRERSLDGLLGKEKT